MSFLYREVVNWIESEIAEGRLKPGMRLPSEMELADQFGVSRITIKRAMEELTKSHVVERFRGRGTFVSSGRIQSRSPLATSFESERSTHRRIGFVAPELSDLFGVKMFNGIDNRCQEHGMTLQFARSQGDLQRESAIIERWREEEIDGIIVFPVHEEFYSETLIQMVLNNEPLVLVDRTLHGLQVPSVMTDHYAATRDLTDWLVNSGHQSLAFISPPSLGTTSLEERHRGFIDLLEARAPETHLQGHRLFISSVVPGRSWRQSFDESQKVIADFLHHNAQISAVLASEYALALMVRNVLNSDPELAQREITITCFDTLTGYPISEKFPHVLQDEQQIGEMAFDLLFRRISGETFAGRHHIPHKLVLS